MGIYLTMAAPVSFASITEKKAEDTTPLRVVHIDGHAVLKIAKHSKEGMPTLVTGQLLGLDVGQTLEVTDCFPFPVEQLNIACQFSNCEDLGRLLCLELDGLGMKE